MTRGSKFAEFLSKGAYAVLQPGTAIAASRTAAAAALIGVVLAASAASAQTVPPQNLPPAPPTTHSHAPQTQAPGQHSESRNQTQQAPQQHGAQARPQSPTSPPRTERQNERLRGDVSVEPFALGAAIGVLATQPQPVYVQQPQYYAQPQQYAPPPPGYGQQYDNGSPPGYAGTAPAPGYAAGPAAPIPAEGRARDPGSIGQYYTFGTDRIDARHVHATVAAAMALGDNGQPGVDPAALMALQSRSAAALAKLDGGEDSNAPIDGPFAYSTQRWLAAFARFMPSLGRADLAGQIRRVSGQLEVDTQEAHEAIMGMRGDPYVSSLLAGAEMVSNDTRFRASFGFGPNLAELAVGHHAGAETMLKVAMTARQNPGAPLATVIGDARARDLIVLTGLEGIVPPNVGTAQFIGTLDNAFKNGLTRYQAVRTVTLPADYRPGSASAGHLPEDEPTPGPRPR